MIGAVIAILLQLGYKHDVTGIPKQSGKHYMTSHVKPKPVLHTAFTERSIQFGLHSANSVFLVI